LGLRANLRQCSRKLKLGLNLSLSLGFLFFLIKKETKKSRAVEKSVTSLQFAVCRRARCPAKAFIEITFVRNYQCKDNAPANCGLPTANSTLNLASA
jgi:hypothetical protein